MSKFGKSFVSFLKIMGLIILCIGAAFAIVWPLWKFATAASRIYTIVVLSLIAILIVYFIVKKIIKNIKKHA